MQTAKVGFSLSYVNGCLSVVTDLEKSPNRSGGKKIASPQLAVIFSLWIVTVRVSGLAVNRATRVAFDRRQFSIRFLFFNDFAEQRDDISMNLLVCTVPMIFLICLSCVVFRSGIPTIRKLKINRNESTSDVGSVEFILRRNEAIVLDYR